VVAAVAMRRAVVVLVVIVQMLAVKTQAVA